MPPMQYRMYTYMVSIIHHYSSLFAVRDDVHYENETGHAYRQLISPPACWHVGMLACGHADADPFVEISLSRYIELMKETNGR